MRMDPERLDATWPSSPEDMPALEVSTGDGGHGGDGGPAGHGAPEEQDLLERELVKRALFPRRTLPVKIGRFMVLGLVGRGGMGVVYACYDDLLDRKVAVKVLHGEVGSEHAAARLRREAQALAKLNHPNVVAVHDVGSLGERVYLAMEFIDGQTLTTWSTAARPGWREVLRVIVAAGDGLAAAHAKGLVHRDIKPDNIMIGADGRVRVMDFGLAHVGHDAGDTRPTLTPGVLHGDDALVTALTRTGALLGTPAYMASEQFFGQPADARADQFSLCATAWAALYGRPPYAGDSLAPLIENVTMGTLTAPPAGSKVPVWLRRVLERGLRVRAEDRYPDVRALLAALRADPTRRRRIAGAGAAAAMLVVAAVGAGVMMQRNAVAMCEAAGAVIDEDWNEASRAALERSFLATGKVYAPTTLARTLPWFDVWAETWRDAAVAGCRAATIEGRWDADLRARGEDCLEEARGNFVALVRELSDTDATGLARATAAAAGLASVASCARPESLRERPTMEPAQAGAVRAVRAGLAQASSLEAAGDYTRGLAVARATVTAARATGWAPVVAQAEQRAGSLAERAGDYAGAEASLRAALAAAGEARAPMLVLGSTIDLVYLVGYRASRHAEGRVWGEAARMQLALASGEHPLERADLENHLAGVEYVTGNYAGSARRYAEALALREAALGPDHPRVAESLNNLASARFALGTYDEAADLYLRALALFERTLGPDHPQVATTLSNLSLVYQSTGAYDKATAVLRRAIEIREAALGPEHPQMAGTLSNLALVHQSMGAYEEAARLFLRALELDEKALGPDHPTVADALHNLALVRVATGALDEAHGLFTRSLEIYERLEKGHPMTANSMVGLGQVALARGRHEEALGLFTRAQAVLASTTAADHPLVANMLLGLGETLRVMGRAPEAIAALERALEIRTASEVSGEELAQARFALARALGPGSPRARELAQQALQAYGPRREQVEVAAWLATAMAPAVATRP